MANAFSLFRILVSLFTVYINQILNTFFKAATGTMDYNEAVRGLASSTLGGILGTYQLGSLLAERSNVQ